MYNNLWTYLGRGKVKDSFLEWINWLQMIAYVRDGVPGIILLFSRFRFCVVAFKFLRRVGWISVREIGRAHGSGGYCVRPIGDLSDWTLPSP